MDANAERPERRRECMVYTPLPRQHLLLQTWGRMHHKRNRCDSRCTGGQVRWDDVVSVVATSGPVHVSWLRNAVGIGTSVCS